MVKKSYVLAGLLVSFCLAIGALTFLSVRTYNKSLALKKQTVSTEKTTSATLPNSPSEQNSVSQAPIQPRSEEEIQQPARDADSQQWVRSLPLYKDNLTFLGKEKASVIEHSPIRCTPFEQFHLPSNYQVFRTKNQCELYVYSDGTKSIFHFENDILRAREELTHGNHVSARYIFFPPPPYDPKDDPLAQLPIRGLVVQEQFYQNSTMRVNTFGPDGFVLQKVERTSGQLANEPENLQMEVVTYLPNHQFTGYTKGIRKTVSTIITQRLELSNSSHSPLPENTYEEITSSAQGEKIKTGSWTLNKKTNTVILDNGKQFAPSDGLPRAKTYCEIYPTGCYQIPDTQENEIAIIN